MYITPPRDVSDYNPRKEGARCDLCPLAGNTYVPFSPPADGKKPKFIIVGEGPGRKELMERSPFVGMTGQILNDELETAGLNRDEAHVTNAAMCLGETDKENERAGECCAPRLLKELAALPADAPIIPLGKAATRAILGVKSILIARGFVWTARDLETSIKSAEGNSRKAEKLSVQAGKVGLKAEKAAFKAIETDLRLETLRLRHKLAGRTILPTLHPTFAFVHNETWAPIFRIDLNRAARFIRGELTHDMLADKIELVKTVTELRRKKRTFIVTDNVKQIEQVAKLLGPEVGCDIETERLKPLSPLLAKILCVQISDGDRSIVIAPWDARLHRKVLSEFLKDRTVVFHNGYCVHGDTLVVLADGTTRKIKDIVNKQERPLVMALNTSGAMEASRVVGWSKTRQSNQRWVKIRCAGTPYGMKVTPEHQVCTTRGWVEADNVTQMDAVAQVEPLFSAAMRAALLGTLLGDSSMRGSKYMAGITGGHAISSGLTKHKTTVMPFLCAGKPYTPKSNFDNCDDVHPYKSKYSREVAALRACLYDKKGNKHLRVSTLDQLGAIGLAWWFMDDGCLQKRAPNDRVSLATNCFSFEEVQEAADWITNRFGQAWACRSSNVLALSATAAAEFCAYIAPHVPHNMRYKFPRNGVWPAYIPLIFDVTDNPQFAQVISVDYDYRAACWVGPNKYMGEDRYCLRVQKNRNFFTVNGLVHNCFDQPALERPGEDVDLSHSQLEDTLVAHHSFASQYPQKLDHVVATFIDSSPWKIRFGVRGAEEKGLAPVHSDENELYEYGAADAVVTILAWRAMQKDLEPERAVYEHDKLMGIQGKGMQVVGIPVDRKRRRLLSIKLKLRAAALKGRMRTLSRRPNFAPTKLGEVRHVLFNVLKAPMLNPTATGLASTSNATLETIRTGGAGTLRSGLADTKQASGPINNKTRETKAGLFAEALLRWRVAEKIKGTYINAVSIHRDGRAHYNWRPYGTNSGRYSCRLQSCPRWSAAIEDRAREMYLASKGCSLFYFDLSQAEARFAANLSGDANFIETCKKDVHTGNAKILFPDPVAQEQLARDPKGKDCPKHGDAPVLGATCNCGKPFRDIAKNAGFAVAYLAEAPTVFAYLRAHGFPVELSSVETMLDALKASYRRYYEYVAENVAFVEKHGYLRTPLVGRIRWFGFHPKPQEIANCLDDETEALTQRGWVKGFDLKIGDMLLTKNMERGDLTWQPVFQLKKFPRYDGPLYSFKSRSFNAVTTAEHRWLVTDRRECRNRVALTEELAKGRGDLSIHRTGSYVAPTTTIYTDAFVELIGWVLTDGSVHVSPVQVAVYQTKRKNIKRIDAMFERLGATPTRDVRVAANNVKRVIWRFHGGSAMAHEIARLFPKRVLTQAFLNLLTATQLDLLCTTMMLGDGSADDAKSAFFCRDRDRADVFQLLCTMCGIATSARWRGPCQSKKQYASIANRPKSKGIWVITLLRNKTAQVIKHSRRYGNCTKAVDQVTVLPSGIIRPVWCPVVRNTFFVARRHGDVYITGNTPIQSGIADVMNTRLLALQAWLAKELPEVELVAQVHDAAIFNTPDKYIQWGKDDRGKPKIVGPMAEAVERTWAEPVRLKPSVVCREEREFLLPAEIKTGKRWSSFG
jgi:uracil-DNA glycosylase family 4